MTYSHLSDEELINALSQKRMLSPLIEELCTRLYDRIMGKSIETDAVAVGDRATSTTKCPVCDAVFRLVEASND